VLSRACPLFVPLVEEGWLDHRVTRDVAQEYLSPLRADGVSALVLGCTHYPLLAPLLAELAGPNVALIDSADETAIATADVLTKLHIAAPERVTPPRHRFVASDAPDRFLALGQRFLGGTLDHVEHVTFG
jgi:glutamate racemase